MNKVWTAIRLLEGSTDREMGSWVTSDEPNIGWSAWHRLTFRSDFNVSEMGGLQRPDMLYQVLQEELNANA